MILKPKRLYLTDGDAHSEQFGISEWGPSLTEQEHKDSCDINKIVKHIQKTGEIPNGNPNIKYGEEDMNETRQSLKTKYEESQLAFEHFKHKLNEGTTFEDFIRNPLKHIKQPDSQIKQTQKNDETKP